MVSCGCLPFIPSMIVRAVPSGVLPFRFMFLNRSTLALAISTSASLLPETPAYLLSRFSSATLASAVPRASWPLASCSFRNLSASACNLTLDAWASAALISCCFFASASTISLSLFASASASTFLAFSFAAFASSIDLSLSWKASWRPRIFSTYSASRARAS